MTPLGDLLRRRIRATGPISIADYMHECLLHPELGYYTTKTAIGSGGDFVTAPEISQMFGELLGLSLAQSWLDQGAPTPFALVELGPGHGTLMQDILRATAHVPGFHAALRLCLVEASDRMRARQETALHAHAPSWFTTTTDLPELPLWLVANEFFDALAIRQFVRDGAAWRERQVGLDAAGNLCFGLSDQMAVPELTHRIKDTSDGTLIEMCRPAIDVAGDIGARLKRHGGAALIVDYGDWRSQGDTLQALQAKSFADPLADPGAADLTAHVDFEALALSSGVAHSRLTPQGTFLERLGIAQRAAKLAAGLRGKPLDQHWQAYRRLTHADEMGTLFKVIALTPSGAAPPPGVEI